MQRSIAVLLTSCLLLIASATARADNGRPTGRQIEQFLIDIPTSQRILDDLNRLNAQAHYAGSVGDHDVALWMRDRLQQYGFTVRIEPFYAQVPQLKNAVLQLMERPAIDFDLKESRIAEDPDGWRTDAGVPFNAWSGSGDVTAPLVFANHGLDADYQTLANAGVAVAGRIVLIRYGAEFRGDLARRAVARGAAGILFYDDPDDPSGASRGPAYPDGPYRPLGSVQRGSLAAPAIAIPSFPISALVAQRLLQDIDGASPPAGWRGGLGAGYALGASRVPVHLRVEESYSPVYLWNTVGVLPGRDISRTVILGGHRDAWVYGVTDNGAGISTLLEAARALGYIYQAGWRPQYSIVIAGWDGEEVGELGSKEFVRAHAVELRRGCVAYVNADENVTGNFFYSSGVAALSDVLPPLSRRVPDPRDRTRTIWQKWHDEQGGVRTESPGGGSDHEPFLYQLGIPVLDFAFAGPFGVYHSAYDDVRYARTQADPDFVAHRAASQLLALLAFQMTSSDVLPYRVTPYVGVMRDAFGRLSAQNGVGADLSPLAQAIDRFAGVAARLDGRNLRGERAMQGIRQLNLLLYGRSGYQSTVFPGLSGPMSGGQAAAANQAAKDVAAGLDAATALLLGAKDE